MTDLQRKKVFDALLGDVSMFAPGDVARRALEESARGQLEAVETVIDRIIEGMHERYAAAIREVVVELMGMQGGNVKGVPFAEGTQGEAS